ncbi:hypothetical protein L209DRAFT_97040 [Thermothelomyces heterothallicus CBS 203.75]
MFTLDTRQRWLARLSKIRVIVCPYVVQYSMWMDALFYAVHHPATPPADFSRPAFRLATSPWCPEIRMSQMPGPIRAAISLALFLMLASDAGTGSNCSLSRFSGFCKFKPYGGAYGLHAPPHRCCWLPIPPSFWGDSVPVTGSWPRKESGVGWVEMER